MRKILKGAVVLLVAVALIFTSVAVTADTVNEKIQVSKAGIKSIKSTQTEPNTNPALGPVLFSQLPYEPDESWGFYTSSVNLAYLCMDDFWELTAEICDVHWWGLSLFWTGSGWTSCDPVGMVFEIIIYDVNGIPACSYQVSPPAIATGKFYSGYQMYYWEVDLDPCCPMQNGWISIQCLTSQNGCTFLWAGSPDGNLNALQNGNPLYDSLAFELTGYEPCEPCIDVEKYVWDEKNQEWVDADTEDTALDVVICKEVTFKIVIHNCGNGPLAEIVVKDKMHNSLKYLSSDPEGESRYEEPFWYIDWFIPGPLMPCETKEIYVTAHVEGPECSTDFNYVYVEGYSCGQVVHDEDYAYVHAKEKAREFNTPILNFLQSHPNMFPLLQTLLQRFGVF